MSAEALLASLIMDKFNKTAAPKGAKRRRVVKGKGLKKKKKVQRKWKNVKLPSGATIKVAKVGYLQTPMGRYVKDTVANRVKYFPELEYADNATNVPRGPAAMNVDEVRDTTPGRRPGYLPNITRTEYGRERRHEASQIARRALRREYRDAERFL